MDYTLILLAIIFIETMVILLLICTNKEKFTESSIFLDDLVYLMKTKPSYTKYLEFLIENKNKSLNLVVKSNYMKLLKEAEDDIISAESIVKLA
jgi:hypothetical protein